MTKIIDGDFLLIESEPESQCEECGEPETDEVGVVVGVSMQRGEFTHLSLIQRDAIRTHLDHIERIINRQEMPT